MNGDMEPRILGYTINTFRIRCPTQYQVLKPLLDDCPRALSDGRVMTFLQSFFAKYSEGIIRAVARHKAKALCWDTDVLKEAIEEFLAENPKYVTREGQRSYPLAVLFTRAAGAIKTTDPSAARRFRLHVARIYALATRKSGRQDRA